MEAGLFALLRLVAFRLFHRWSARVRIPGTDRLEETRRRKTEQANRWYWQLSSGRRKTFDTAFDWGCFAIFFGSLIGVPLLLWLR